LDSRCRCDWRQANTAKVSGILSLQNFVASGVHAACSSVVPVLWAVLFFVAADAMTADIVRSKRAVPIRAYMFILIDVALFRQGLLGTQIRIN
jgi:hypothetical protein